MRWAFDPDVFDFAVFDAETWILDDPEGGTWTPVSAAGGDWTEV